MRNPFRRKAEAVKKEPKPYAISDIALAKAAEKEVARFEPYEPPPGVIPSGQRQSAIALDSVPYDYVNAQANGSGSFVGYFFPGYQELAAMAQLPEYRKMSEEPAREMVREWIKLHGTGDDDKSEKIAQVEEALERFNVREICRKAAELDSFFGRAQLYIDVDMPSGKLASEDYDELPTPLAMKSSKIKKGSLHGFQLVEPIWTYPSAYNADNPLASNYYRPNRWFVMGKTVHDSRLLLFVSRQVPDLLKPAYNFGGVSMTQMARPYVEHWIRTRDSISDMVHSFSVSGIKTNMEATLTGATDATFAKRAQLFNSLRDNRGLMLLDKDSEDFFQFNTPLGGLHELQAQSQEHMSAVSNIPLVKLLGITPTGLNASSEGEIQVYYDYIASMQEVLFRKPLEKIIDIIQLNEFGEIDDEIGFDFEPLYGMDETETAQVREMNARGDASLVSVGAISPDEVRRRLANDPDSGYDGLDVEDEGGELDDRENLLTVKSKINDDSAMDEQWEESKHPRRDDGKFGEGAGSSANIKNSGKKKDSLSDAGKRESWPAHIKALKLPPAWTDVKINHDPDADLQAVGKDAKGRSQYVYSQRYKDSQAQAKFERTRALMKEFPVMQTQVHGDLTSDNAKTQQSAECMSLIMKMGIRPGSETNTGADKKAYGATTLEAKHVKMEGENVTLSFVGKKGVQLDLPVHDEALKAMLSEKAGSSNPDQKLFPAINNKVLLDYSHSLDGGHFKTKDFRTHVGTTTAIQAMQGVSAPSDEKSYKKTVKAIAKQVSTVLGNTPTIALQSYIDPAVFSEWRVASGLS